VLATAPSQKQTALVRARGVRLEISAPRTIGQDESGALGIGEKFAKFAHPVPDLVRTVAVSDLMNRKIIRHQYAAVSLDPAVAVRDQIRGAQGGREGEVQPVIEGEVGAAADEPQERRIPLERNGPTRLRDARQGSDIKEAEVHNVVTLRLRIPERGVRVLHKREPKNAAADAQVILLARGRKSQMLRKKIDGQMRTAISRQF